MSNKENDSFGKPCHWFTKELNTASRKVIPTKVRWVCPIDNCEGEMVFNGMTWLSNPIGCHHTCDKCGFTAAIEDMKYPKITYEDI